MSATEQRAHDPRLPACLPPLIDAMPTCVSAHQGMCSPTPRSRPPGSRRGDAGNVTRSSPAEVSAPCRAITDSGKLLRLDGRRPS